MVAELRFRRLWDEHRERLSDYVNRQALTGLVRNQSFNLNRLSWWIHRNCLLLKPTYYRLRLRLSVSVTALIFRLGCHSFDYQHYGGRTGIGDSILHLVPCAQEHMTIEIH